MKHLITLTILILLTSLNACQRPDYPQNLRQAESMMNTRPDSALQLLQGMADSIAMLPEEAQMYYHLLTIQAKDKQYITHTSDSLINRIVSFYENYDDKERLMMAYYYQGSVYRDMKDAPRALKAFQQAMDLHVPNYDLQAKAYNQMGTLFMYQGLYDEVIRVNRKAMELYISQGKRNRISYFLRDIARMYSAKEMTDSALYYYKGACQTAFADGDSVRYYGILGELGGYFVQIGNNNSAKKLLKLVEKKSYIQNKSNIYTMLGHVYHKLDMLDSAYYYYNKNSQSNDIKHKYSNLRDLFHIEKNRKNYKQAINYINKALILKDSIDIITQTKAIAQINALYNYQHIEAKNNRLNAIKEKQEKQILILLLFLLISLLCSTIFYFIQKEKRLNELETEKQLKKMAQNNYATSLEVIQSNEKKIEALNIELQKALLEKDVLKTELVQIQQRKLEKHNEEIILIKKEQELRIVTFHNSSIFHLFKQASTDENVNLCSTKSQPKWKELEKNIDDTYPHFREQLTILCPKLSTIEIRVCLLTKVGITPTGIATLLKYSRQGISNIRTRIHKRIQKLGGEYANFDDFIDSF